jgi:aspartate carbamoyltransferase catalytic subunit
MKQNAFYLKDILTSRQFTKEDVGMVLAKTKEMRDMVKAKGASDVLKGKIMTALFYEPSSRTFGSFVTAIQRLGGGFIPLQGVVYSSVAKGETLEDTVRTFGSFSDIIVIRHPQEGAAKIAADAVDKPVINAGDGPGEHPTQALLDLFTISDHFPGIDGLNITFVGDLLYGRTVHSLTTLLSLYTPKCITYVSPGELKMPSEFIQMLEKKNIAVKQTDELEPELASTDVLYVTRVQKERFRDLDVYEKLKHRYIITKDSMGKLNKKAILMHPFPRVGEIALDVDSDPRALYIREEMRNGMFVRMALLSLVLAE